jgi:two-component system OmpR family response regulator
VAASVPRATILLVDDEPDALKVFGARLRANGYAVVTALGGREGMEKALQARPDLAILDLMMPDVDGRDVAAALRADPATRGVPVIYLTALLPGETTALATSGAVRTEVLSKTSRPEVILDTIRRLLAQDGPDAPGAA